MVIKTGLEAIAKNVYAGLETVVFCGFTHEEQRVIGEFVAQGFSDLQIYRTVPRGQGRGLRWGVGTPPTALPRGRVLRTVSTRTPST